MLNRPLDDSLKLSKDDSPRNKLELNEMDNISYEELVGGIFYLTNTTRIWLMLPAS